MNAAKLASDTYDGWHRERRGDVCDCTGAYNREQFNVLMRTQANLDISPQLVRWIGTSLMKNKIGAAAMVLGFLAK